MVPQLADAERVFAGITRRPDVRYAAFVPNAKGAERAIAVGVDDLKSGIAVSDTFNELNVRMTTEQGMRALEEIAAAWRRARGSRLVGAIATAFGCPYEGKVSATRLHILFGAIGAASAAPIIYLADTTGVANPDSIPAHHRGAVRRAGRNQRIGLHLHNTRGLGLANAYAGLAMGITDFEGSVGGLGGCPFAPRAVGNICTEDFVNMVHDMGYETGIDLDRLVEAARARARRARPDFARHGDEGRQGERAART